MQVGEVLGEEFAETDELALWYFFNDNKIIIGPHKRGPTLPPRRHPRITPRHTLNKQLQPNPLLPPQYLKLIRIQRRNLNRHHLRLFCNLLPNIKHPFVYFYHC